MTKYRKRPSEVEARLFSGMFTIPEAHSLAHWCGGEFLYDDNPGQANRTYYWSITLTASNGRSVARPGDYIVRDEKGELHVYSGEVFEKAYERVR